MSANANPLQVISNAGPSFEKLVQEKGYPVFWKQECIFARQQIQKNDYAFNTAASNPNSLQTAILNVAAIGISLNPALAHAYLVPRDGAIYLDISYKGLVKIATESGAIQWAKSELVYKADRFVYNGPCTPPTHEAEVFSDRGEIIGGYCIAKLHNGEYMIEIMKIDDINKVRDVSKAYQKKKGPWVDWFEEMAKKTITKRASKSWPQTENRDRLDIAIQALHESEGTAFTIEQQSEYLDLIRKNDAIGLLSFEKSVSEKVWVALYNSFEKGQKVEYKKKVDELCTKGHEEIAKWALEIKQSIDEDRIEDALETYNDLNPLLIDSYLGEYKLQLTQENA